MECASRVFCQNPTTRILAGMWSRCWLEFKSQDFDWNPAADIFAGIQQPTFCLESDIKGFSLNLPAQILIGIQQPGF